MEGGQRGPVSVGASWSPMGCLVPVMCVEGSQWQPSGQLSWGLLFLRCHESGLAPAACPVTLAQLSGGEGTLQCPCGSRSMRGAWSHRYGDVGRVHASAGHEEGAGVEGAAVRGSAPWHCGCHSLWVHRSWGVCWAWGQCCRCAAVPSCGRLAAHPCLRPHKPLFRLSRPCRAAGSPPQRSRALSFGRSWGRTHAPASPQGCSPMVGIRRAGAGAGAWGLRDALRAPLPPQTGACS